MGGRSASLPVFQVGGDSPALILVTLLRLTSQLVGKSNSNALSDVGTAAMLAYAGLRGGAMNVRINLGGIADAEHAARARERVQRIEVEGENLREEGLRAVFSTGSLQ